MSEPEDAKPKLNLVISLLESRTFSPLAAPIYSSEIRHHLRAGITVKVKANMQFKKIFEVAEVCRNISELSRTHLTRLPAFQKRFGKDPGALVFTTAA